MDQNNALADFSREERRAQIKEKKKRKIKSIAIIAVTVILAIALIVVINSVVKHVKDLKFHQIGPFPPSENDELVSVKLVYNYSEPVPEAKAVGNKHFESALFIGDVRVQGIGIYMSDIYTSTIYSGSMTAQNALTDTFSTGADKSSTVMAECSGKKSIYIMLGLNETGWGYPELYEDYLNDLVTAIKAVNPDASIYISSTVPFTEKAASSRSYISLELIESMNEIAQRVAASQRVYYINVSEALSSKGWLENDYAEANGLSLSQNGYTALFDYLKTHTVDKEQYS